MMPPFFQVQILGATRSYVVGHVGLSENGLPGYPRLSLSNPTRIVNISWYRPLKEPPRIGDPLGMIGPSSIRQLEGKKSICSISKSSTYGTCCIAKDSIIDSTI